MDAISLALHRKGTEDFIAADPIDIVLIPSGKTEDAGTAVFSDSPPRTVQRFRAIYPGSLDGIVPTTDGTTRRFDIVLVGKYTAVAAIGDHWKIGNQFYEIEWIAPQNDYELKVGGTSHGSSPD
jgi:hypothetical protein